MQEERTRCRIELGNKKAYYVEEIVAPECKGKAETFYVEMLTKLPTYKRDDVQKARERRWKV